MTISGQSERRSHIRTRLSFIFRIVLTGTILYLLVRLVGWQELRDALRQTEWLWLLAMYAVTLTTFVTNGSMFKLMLKKIGLSVSLRRVLMANSLSTFYTLILPSDILAGVAKWADLSAATGDKSRVLSALVFAKIALAIAPMFFGTLALAFNSPFPGLPLPVIAGSLCTIVICATFLILNPTAGAFIERGALNLARRLPHVLSAPISSVLNSLKYFRKLMFIDHIQILSFSAAIFSISIIGFSFAIHAVGETAAFTTLAWISMTLFILRLLPITISNLGIRESLMVWALGQYGIDAGPALLVGLLMFSNSVFVGLAGALYQLALAFGWMKWKPHDSHA